MRTLKQACVLTIGLLTLPIFVPVQAQELAEEQHQIPEIFPERVVTERFGICVFDGRLPHCPDLASPSDECDSWSELSDNDRRAIHAACSRLSRLRALRGHEVHLDMRVALGNQGSYLYRVRLRVMQGEAQTRSVELTDRRLVRALNAAARALTRSI